MTVTIPRVIGLVLVATFCVGVALISGHRSAPSASANLTLIWGDSDCSGAVAPRDGQADLNHFLGQAELSQTPPCPTIGDPVTLGAGSSPTPTPSPSPTPHSNSTFGDGTWLLGSDIPAGLYRNSDSSGGCYWARLSGLGGTLGEIIANNFTDSIDTVQISPGDVAFESARCGTWSQTLIPPSSGPTQPFSDGTWIVGQELAPGTWRNSDSSGDCYWARLSGFSGRLEDIIANNIDTSIQTVQIAAGDDGFTSSRCGTWTKIG